MASRESRGGGASGHIKGKSTKYGSIDHSYRASDGGHPDDYDRRKLGRVRNRKQVDDESESPSPRLSPGHQQEQQLLHAQPQQDERQQGRRASLGQQPEIQQGQVPPQQGPQDPPQQIHQPQYQRGKPCKIFDSCLIGVPAALLLACIGLLIYVGYMGDHVQLNGGDRWFSSTENYSLNDHHLHWYASEVCIKELSQEHQHKLDDNQVTVMLAKKPCKYATPRKTLRTIKKSFTSDFYRNARLYFYWISKTSISFEVSITSDTKVGYLTVYIFHREEQDKECVIYHNKLTRTEYYFDFNFNGSSTSDVNCTQENNTTVCWSSPVAIPKTQHYYVCMLFSSEHIDKESVTVTYNLIANEVTYDLTDTYENVQCHLNKSNCCISYNSFFQEMSEPSCIFLKTSATGNDNQAVELPVPLTITSKRRWTAVKYLAIPTSVFSLLCVAASVYVIIKWRYRNRHPNQEDYVRLADAARTCFCS